jgi:hypothetical protein
MMKIPITKLDMLLRKFGYYIALSEEYYPETKCHRVTHIAIKKVSEQKEYTFKSEETYLLSCINEAKHLLDICPEENVIDRMSMEGHIEELEGKLEKLREEQ